MVQPTFSAWRLVIKLETQRIEADQGLPRKVVRRTDIRRRDDLAKLQQRSPIGHPMA